VPEFHLLVLGDSRSQSCDSRVGDRVPSGAFWALRSRSVAARVGSRFRKQAERRAEDDVPHAGLAECAHVGEQRRNADFAARGVVPVGEVGERRVEGGMLRKGHGERQPSLVHVHSPPNGVVGQAEQSPVQRMQGESGDPPATSTRDPLSEDGHVRVVAAEEPLVDRFEQTPNRGGNSACDGRVQALFHRVAHALQVVGAEHEPGIRREIRQVEAGVGVGDTAGDHAERTRPVVDLDDHDVALGLHADAGTLERATGCRGVVDEQDTTPVPPLA
jgi:hypothetical protein